MYSYSHFCFDIQWIVHHNIFL